jgi:hypothetical protein
MKKSIIILLILFSSFINAQCDDILVPNAFTPLYTTNQSFYPYIQTYDDYLLYIYNRYGFLIYEGKEWDGKYREILCEYGLYNYIIKAVKNDCERYFYGTVLLVK